MCSNDMVDNAIYWTTRKGEAVTIYFFFMFFDQIDERQTTMPTLKKKNKTKSSIFLDKIRQFER